MMKKEKEKNQNGKNLVKNYHHAHKSARIFEPYVGEFYVEYRKKNILRVERKSSDIFVLK
jgi:hypothetical protein